MRPEEIAMLPPTERASVIQLVRLNLIIWIILFSLARGEPARVLRHSLISLSDMGFVASSLSFCI